MKQDVPTILGDGRSDLSVADALKEDIQTLPEVLDAVVDLADSPEVVDLTEVQGEVECVPNCDGKDCDDDGCGGSCGECAETLVCVEGICRPDYCAFGLKGFGCCVDQIRLWCDDDGKLEQTDCSGNNPPYDTCGWDAGKYECGGDGEAPDGMYPLECCTPKCGGKECGKDGCWGSCGNCPDVQETCEEGKCICHPACDGKECGDDGCQGVCGECNDQSECVEGQCVCTPDCEGKECGPDGCNGDCGTCNGEQETCVEGLCVCQPDCTALDCGTGGCNDLGNVCGTCDGQDECIEGLCVCQPACEGLECGNGGCEDQPDSCGTCVDGYDCSEGTCAANCDALCGEQECGTAGSEDECQCGFCDDENPCNGVEACNEGQCAAGQAVDCSNVPQCMLAECNPLTGECDLPVDNGTGCSDENACTVDDVCAGGECVPGDMVTCPDPTECASFECNTGTGECKQSNELDGTSCEDGSGECAEGNCVPKPTCPLEDCPDLNGYTKSCNDKAHCEYARTEQTEDWHQWDVWIYVPPGSFEMGSETGEDDELPVHTATLDYGYLVGKYEIVVDQYEACQEVEPTRCTVPSVADWSGGGWGLNSSTNGRTNHPQNGLTWAQARNFCSWVGPGGRLPSEAEWEFAAGGKTSPKYPWGDEPTPTCMNDTAVFSQTGDAGGYGCGTGGTWPAGSKLAGASSCGALDMVGSLGEWCEDSYVSSYDGSPTDGTPLYSGPGPKAARGGSFSSPAANIRTASRVSSLPGEEYAHFGARCVRPAPANECGGVTCPTLDGYFTYCNRKDHCEYANLDTAGHKKWDVWIYIPPGSFEMGSPLEEVGHKSNEEDPSQPDGLHPVTFAAGFFIGKYEAAVEQYDSCVENGVCAPAAGSTWNGDGWGTNTTADARHDHPQNGITWEQAGTFCGWATPGGRLPSEAEWEYAASGPVHKAYPWGNEPNPSCDAANSIMDQDGGGYRPWGCLPCTTEGCSGTMRVGSAPAGASAVGALDMSGNVYEWCLDWDHASYEGTPSDGSAYLVPGSNNRMLRGGAFQSTPNSLRVSSRSSNGPTKGYADTGMRCVRPLACTPDCNGKECGDDGCGGSCGDCGGGMSCQDAYCVAATPVWHDVSTGLEWQNPAYSGWDNWEGAVAYCENLALDGGGWSLPTIDQLRTLVRGCPNSVVGGACQVGEGCLAKSCADDIECAACELEQGPSDGCYWPPELLGECETTWSSSTVLDSAGEVWALHFNTGLINIKATGGIPKRIRCVR